MAAPETTFRESKLLATPIRELGLRIEGTPLEAVLEAFRRELERAGIRKLRPHFYLSLEWGVPFGSVSIAIPFYLASPELTALQKERTGHVEGASRAELLRFLRHEMGHVVNYAYKLYEDEDWIRQFGSITQPYLDDYRPEPFSRRYVQHLPGWYAQKHPDEDWAETFAVWLTPRRNWRREYADAPEALAKLEFCDRSIAALRDREPLVTDEDFDEDATQEPLTVQEVLGNEPSGEALPPGLDGSLRAIFEDADLPEDLSEAARVPAAQLIRNLAKELPGQVFRWTGHFPEKTRELLEHLAVRAEELNQVYTADRQANVAVALTALVTALAMNHVHRGTYLP
jgi:hypothetical protein